MKKYIIVSVIIAAILKCCVIVLAGHSRNMMKNAENKTELFVDAYGVMTEYLSDEALLPEFDTAELVEETFWASLNEDSLRSLAEALDKTYPYPVSISHGHDRIESKSDSTAYIYLSHDFEYSGFNKVKVEGFINDNSNLIMLYYTYRSGVWCLVFGNRRALSYGPGRYWIY